jgi:predicted exporter
VSRSTGIGLVAIALGLIVYCAFNLRVGTNVTHFMPDDSPSELARVSTQLTDSPFTRTMVLSIESQQLAVSIEAAKELRAVLAEHPEVAWVRGGIDDGQLEDVFQLYFPRRMLFLSDRPESEVPQRFDEGALRESARELKRQLASPAATFLTQIAPQDPLGSFRELAQRFRQDESTLEMRGGQFVTRDGRYAILMLATRHSAFASGAQMPFLADLEAAFEQIAERRGAGLSIEMSGANRYAVAAEQTMKADIYKIGACSFLGVAVLFFLFVGGWRSFLIVSVPPAAGILVATSLGLFAFGDLDGITMAFGASLMGIAIDYSNHVLIHQRLDTGEHTAFETARRLRPSLSLGAATTVASFGGLAITAFPAFREMSFFAAVGVLTALFAALVPLPALIRFAPELPERSSQVAAWLGHSLQRLERAPRALLFLPIGLLPLAGVALSQLEWEEDMSKLTTFPQEMLVEGERVRDRIARMESGIFAIGIADDEAGAVALNDVVHGRLTEAVEAGELEGARSLHGILWSGDLQRRNWELASAPGNYARLDAAFAAEGFRPGAFREFGQLLEGPAPEPLTIADLQASPLADLLTPFFFRLGEQLAVVSYLRGLNEPDAVRARLQDLERVHLLDQRSFVNDIFGEFRVKTLQQMAIGALLVGAILALRYRAWRPALAAFLPSVTVVILLLAILSLLGVRPNLMHAMSLIMVMGMGVDYGVFLVDSAGDREALGATLLSLLMSCLTTMFVFGTLAISSQPVLRAIGVTTGIGILLSFLLAPVTLAALRLSGGTRSDA